MLVMRTFPLMVVSNSNRALSYENVLGHTLSSLRLASRTVPTHFIPQ